MLRKNLILVSFTQLPIIKFTMRRVQYSILFLLLLNVAWGQELKVTIEGNATFNNSQFSIREAGEDFHSSIESESSLYISVLYSNYWDKQHSPH